MSPHDLLLTHPAVAAARPHPEGVEVTLHPGGRVTPGQLRAMLRRTLSEAQLPERILVTSASANPEAAAREQTIAAGLARIWGDEVGVTPTAGTRFLEAGGDSLIAARVVHRAQLELELDGDAATIMRLLLDHPFDLVAAKLASLPRREQPTTAPELAQVVADEAARFEPFPLTDQQQAYVLGRGDLFSSGGLSCHTYVEFDGRGLDLERFGAAWRRIVERHDALRTRIDGETMMQRVEPPAPADAPVEIVEVVDARSGDESAQLDAVRERLSHRVAPIDGRMFDVVVVLLPGDRQRICIGIDMLVGDLASSTVLFDELQTLYAEPSAEPPLPGIRYRDLVLADLAARSTPEHAENTAYWHERVEHLPEAPDLPLAVDPASIETPRFATRHHRIDAERWAGLRAIAAREGITPSVLLATAYAETIAFWSASQRFTLNLPIVNRPRVHPDVDRVVGELATFTLLEVDLADGARLVERARALQTRLWRDLAHGGVTGIEVLREIVRRRGGAGSATMPIVFTGTTMVGGMPASLFDGAFVRTYRLSKTPQVWLDLIVEEHEGELLLSWDALEAVFPDGLMDDMSGALVDVLGRLAAGEHDPSPVRPAWQRELVDAVAGPVRPSPRETVHAAFDRRAHERPDAPAVIAADRQITYGRLRDEAVLLGRRLRAAGAGRDVPVGVVVGRGWRTVVAPFGAQYAAAAYLPIDPDMPPRRVREVLDRAGARILITDAQAPEALAAYDGLDLVRVEADDLERFADRRDALPEPAFAEPGDLCVVLPTSGSTGMPKLVACEHHAIVNFAVATNEEYGITADDRAFAVTPVYHDMSLFDLFGVLGVGGSLVVPSHARDAWHWAQLADEHGVTLWNSVPASFEMALEAGTRFDRLRLVFLGGDWIRTQLVRELPQRVPSARLVSVGGATETTAWNIWHPVDDLAPDARSVPYGRAIPNARYHVIDERGRERPLLAVGELGCTGTTLARGYLGDPERTAVSFAPNAETGERMYRTGDVGRFLHDGTIEFMGRVDHRLKIRGKRIEPGEVEHELLQHPEVRAGLVAGIPSTDGNGHRGLVAYVVPGVPDGLEAWLGERLAPHLVPHVFIGLERMPLSANGKIDRRALPAPEASDDAGAAPIGDLEAVLCELWSAELGGAPVGRDDDFFRLGGDSLVATRLIARVRDELPGSQPGIRALFQAPTVAGMAAALAPDDDARAVLERVAALRQRVSRMTTSDIERQLAERNARR